MAWSLYELLNVGAASNPDNTESNLYTYDILNRNCFGSYFDILKEMTFSPKMGEQFNFAESASTRLSWDTSGVMVFPDENYGEAWTAEHASARKDIRSPSHATFLSFPPFSS